MPMPVLPAVPSTTVPPGLRTPRCSASSTIQRAARSLTLPPGFMNSALPRISQPVSSLGPFRRSSGVFPTASTKPLRRLILRRTPWMAQRLAASKKAILNDGNSARDAHRHRDIAQVDVPRRPLEEVVGPVAAGGGGLAEAAAVGAQHLELRPHRFGHLAGQPHGADGRAPGR